MSWGVVLANFKAVLRALLAAPVRIVAWVAWIGAVILHFYARGLATIADLIEGVR